MVSIKTRKEQDIERMLDEILDENISTQTFQEIAEQSLETAQYEKVNSLLLQHYNNKIDHDFQEELKNELKAMVSEKMLSKLEDSKDLERSKEDELNNIAREENIDEDTLEKAKNNIEANDKSKQENEEFNLREELMKQVYIEEFKKYSNRLMELKQIQADRKRSAFEKSEGVSLTIGEDAGYEIVLYEKYLQNLEQNFRGGSNIYRFNNKELNEIEEIKEVKEELTDGLRETEEYIDNKVDNRLNELRELYLKRKEVTKKISELADNENAKHFKAEMDRLQEEYRDLTYQMREKDPSLEKYNEMINIEKENREYADREVGMNSEVGFKGGYSKEHEEIDYTSETVEEKQNEIVKENDENTKQILDDLMSEISLCISQGMYDKAEEYLQSAEDILEIERNERDEAQGEQTKVSNENLDNYIDKDINQKNVKEINEEKENAKDSTEYKDPFDLRNECNDTKIKEEDLDKKLELKERFKRVQQKNNQLYPSNEVKEQDSRVLCRY